MFLSSPIVLPSKKTPKPWSHFHVLLATFPPLLANQSSPVSTLPNRSSLSFCFPCVNSMLETTEQANIQSLSQTRSASLIHPPHPYWSDLLSPFNMPLSDASPTAELPASTSLSFFFPGVKSMPETTERVDGLSLPSHQRTAKTPSWTLPFFSLLSSCNISPTLGTTDSSLPISRSLRASASDFLRLSPLNRWPKKPQRRIPHS